eukprot:CAMPEP_0119063924 /NCGR_PEP_ID=MMETSP1178-20130426/7137_1 /TAXON_ID=33656 /ORGANISM="unid sp, Strain CCMP2000" /LENGTH=230 /DNA_ID=CAMNT_0007045317 /DNA_START=20 /DNA_END=713 /DNA_ORIENTATION=+
MIGQASLACLALYSPSSALSPFPRPRLAPPVLQARQGFSAAERAAARAARAAAQSSAPSPVPNGSGFQSVQQGQAPAPAPAPASDSLDEMLAVVLSEFVQSDYARQCCDYCNVMPLDYGQVEGMFESLQRVDAKLIVKLKRCFEQVNVKLLDRLAKHLRGGCPGGCSGWSMSSAPRLQHTPSSSDVPKSAGIASVAAAWTGLLLTRPLEDGHGHASRTFARRFNLSYRGN